MPRRAQTKTPPKPASDILANATNNAIRVGGLAVDFESSGAGMAAGGESGDMVKNFRMYAPQGNQYSGDFHPESAEFLPREKFSALFFSTYAPYIGGAGSPAMEINNRRNKPFGPGGSTRRLHPSPRQSWRASAGANQDRRGRKGRVFSRYGSADIGPCNSCKRQLCSGCSGRLSGLKDHLKS